jgi:mycothiol S-conjugate amidase
MTSGYLTRTPAVGSGLPESELGSNSLAYRGLRLMAVHAHPDDESSKGGATMAMYATLGAEVLVVTCTGGERGSVLNPKLDRPDVRVDIPRRRRLEMERARQILGVQHEWLGFIDSGLPEGAPSSPLPDGCFAVQDTGLAAERLVRVIRRFRPHVVLAYDEDGGYPHPDHVMANRISVAAFSASGTDAIPAAGEPWQPLKLYYHVHPFGQFLAYQEGMLEAGLEPPFTSPMQELPTHLDQDRRITTRIWCGDYFAVRDAALRAHETQIDPDGLWFSVPASIRRRVWPTEDYELTRSLVRTQSPENDLFAGIREIAGQ